MELDKWIDEYEVEVPMEGRRRVFATISTPGLNTGESARRALLPILSVLLAAIDLARVIAAKGEKWDLLTELFAAFNAKDQSARQTELQTFVARKYSVSCSFYLYALYYCDSRDNTYCGG